MSGSSSKNISQSLTPYGGAITDALPQLYSNIKSENQESQSNTPSYLNGGGSNYVIDQHKN